MEHDKDPNENDRADIAYAKSVNEYSACLNLTRYLHINAVRLNDVADACDDNIVRIHSKVDSKSRLLFQVLVFAVDRDIILRLCQRKHELQLFLTGVSRNVNFGNGGRDDLRARTEKFVYDSVDEFLVRG